MSTRGPPPIRTPRISSRPFSSRYCALPRYDPALASFATWLFGIARHIVTDAYRRRRPTVTWDHVPVSLQPVIDQDLATRLIHRDDLAQLRALVSGLDAEARELLALRFAARLTAPEIAAVIGATEAATKQRLARLMKSLKETYYDTTR